jgi:hypothetical protein
MLEGVRVVVQTMYTHVSKSKNDEIKGERKIIIAALYKTITRNSELTSSFPLTPKLSTS